MPPRITVSQPLNTYIRPAKGGGRTLASKRFVGVSVITQVIHGKDDLCPTTSLGVAQDRAGDCVRKVLLCLLNDT